MKNIYDRCRKLFMMVAILDLIFLIEEENRLTKPAPLQPNPSQGLVHSWTNHLDHQRHYLAASQHQYLMRLGAGVFIFWYSIALSSWIAAGMQNPAKWHVMSEDLKFSSRALVSLFFGGIIAIILTLSDIL